MRGRTIRLFMWGYQGTYRWEIEYLMKQVLEELGVEDPNVSCLLVGARMNADVPYDVCVEPEDGQWPLEIFSGLMESVEEIDKAHELQNMIYGDEPSMQDKPEVIRRDSVRQAVKRALGRYDEENKVRSFAGSPAPLGGYYVVPVLQLPEALFERFRPLREPIKFGQFTGVPSLLHAAVGHVLREAHDELVRPHPGRFMGGRSSLAEEVVRRAGSTFMSTLQLAIRDRNWGSPNLFERFNVISSLMYEGTEGKGKMLLANLEDGAVEVALALADPVPFGKHRWARKVLQMASTETALIANYGSILGLGNLAKGIDPWSTQNVFEVTFHDHHHWSLTCGDEVLLISRYGVPALPQERFPRARLIDTFQRLFPEATADDVSSFEALFQVAAAQPYGSMLVVARDAKDEAARLSGQGTPIDPVKLTPDVYSRVSRIDGTIIVDPHCVCHAVGVILDGAARPECTPSRGSRYNSGIRYVGGSETPRLAVVVSDDRTVDVIPVLRPRIRRSAIEERLAQLEAATHDDYHVAINWLDKHRFYADRLQCDRINAALKRVDAEPREVGEITINWPTFVPNPACTAEYLEPEASGSKD